MPKMSNTPPYITSRCFLFSIQTSIYTTMIYMQFFFYITYQIPLFYKLSITTELINVFPF